LAGILLKSGTGIFRSSVPISEPEFFDSTFRFRNRNRNAKNGRNFRFSEPEFRNSSTLDIIGLPLLEKLENIAQRPLATTLKVYRTPHGNVSSNINTIGKTFYHRRHRDSITGEVHHNGNTSHMIQNPITGDTHRGQQSRTFKVPHMQSSPEPSSSHITPCTSTVQIEEKDVDEIHSEADEQDQDIQSEDDVVYSKYCAYGSNGFLI